MTKWLMCLCLLLGTIFIYIDPIVDRYAARALSGIAIQQQGNMVYVLDDQGRILVFVKVVDTEIQVFRELDIE